MNSCDFRSEAWTSSTLFAHDGYHTAMQAAPYRRTASLSAFAAAATKKFAGPEPAVVEKQPRNKAHSCPAQSAASQQTCSEAAVLPHPGTAANRISPWAALDASAAPAATQGAQQPVAVPRAPEKLQRLPQSTFRTAYQEEHHAELLQLLEDACRQALRTPLNPQRMFVCFIQHAGQAVTPLSAARMRASLHHPFAHV